MTSDEALAFWIIANNRAEIRSERLEQPRAGDVVVRTLHTGISRGSEGLVFRGEVPASERERMRAPFQSGEFPGPVKYGYSNVGVVEAGPHSLRGRSVFALYPHQTRYVVPAESVYLIPAHIPAARAVLAANLETAVNALWDAQPLLGDRIAVVGGGVVGLLVAWLAARIPGCTIELVDTNPARGEIARQLGVGFALPDAATPEADLVVHASGSPAGLATALNLAAFEATVVEMSWYGTRAVHAPLGEAFHSRRLTLRSSQVGSVATSQRPRWTHRRRMLLALDLLDDARLDDLITEESPFERLPEVMARIANGAGGELCHRIVYS